MKKKNYLLQLILILLILLTIVLIILACCHTGIEASFGGQFTLGIFGGLFTGIIASWSLVKFQQINDRQSLSNRYKHLAGTYRLVDAGQDNTSDNKNLTVENIGNRLTLTYSGNADFEYEAELWKGGNSKITGRISFEKTGAYLSYTGYGDYRYSRIDESLTARNEAIQRHFGSIKVFWFPGDGNQKPVLQLLYQHVGPMAPENNPDNNRGWLIYEPMGNTSQ